MEQSWFVEVVRSGRNIAKSGDNLFLADWVKFCEVMRKISGKEFDGAAEYTPFKKQGDPYFMVSLSSTNLYWIS